MVNEIDKWVSQRDEAERALLVAYATMFNTLDAEHFVPKLGDLVTYDSQAVFSSMRGMKEVGVYLRLKTQTLKQAGSAAIVRIDVGELPDGRSCAIAYQAQSSIDRGMLDEPVALMLIEALEDGRAGKMDIISVVPSPSSARNTGLFPGLDEKPLQHNKPPLLHPANDYRQLQIDLWLLDGKISLDANAEQAAQETLQHFPGASLRITNSQTASYEEGNELSDTGITGLPAIVVFWNGQIVMKRNGCPSAENLIAAIKNIIP
jgi:hypothetical protein